MPLLNLDPAPKDPVERVIWLNGVMTQARNELNAHLASAFFEARMQRRLPEAIEAGPVGRKTALAMTRHENERRGRPVRWGDGLS